VRYLADESVERPIVDALRQAGHDVGYVAELAPGASDPDVLARANQESSVLITGDKDFGELVFRQGQRNSGVVLLRLSGLTRQRKAEIATQIFASHARDLVGAFSVVTEKGVRVRRRA
jgi:predicted nuclease of predicted toxin-antitoxin system